MAANPLIAAKEDTTDWSTGISLVSSVTDLSDAISGGSWIEVGLGVVGLAAEAVSLVVDPLGTLAGYGVGWLIEHCQPLQDALDWIAGDPAQIEAYAKTWDNVAARISEVATAQNKAVTTDVTDWTGQTATAYKSAASNTTNLLTAANTASTAAASAIRMAGGIVAAVRETVRDLVAQTVGRLAVWAAELVFSVGLATPLVAIQATAYIAKTVATISKLFSKLAKTMANLKPLLKQLKSAFGDIAKAFKKTPSKSKNADNTTTSPAATKNTDTSTTPSTTKQSDTPTNPASTPDTPAKSPSPGDTAPASTPDLNAKKPESPSKTNDGAPAKARIGDPATTQDAKGTCGRIEPVDMATGEYFVPIVDLELHGVLPIVLWRRHRSNYRYGRWFGPSWSTFLDMRLVVDHSGVTFIAEDGMLLSYPHTTPGAQVVPVHGDHPWPLTRSVNGGYRIHDPEREITWHFAALDPEAEALGDFPITGISDRHDNWIRHHYDHNRNPSHISSSGGYHLTFTVDDSRVTSITVNGTNEVGDRVSTLLREFAYQAGDLVAVTNSVGATTHYTYDRVHRMLTWRDPDNTHFANTYDNLGRIVRQEGTDGILNATVSYETLPNGWGTRTHVINSTGASWSYEFDSQKRLLVETDPNGAATRTDYTDPVSRQPHRIIASDLATTVYYRSEDDNLVRIQRPDCRSITIDYVARNRPSTITNADGAVTCYEYDEAGNVVAIIDPDEVVVRRAYHPNGAVERFVEPGGATTTIDVDTAGQPIRLTDANGNITVITRDHFGRPMAITDPLGNTTRYTWSPEGNLLSRVDADGYGESWLWNGDGKLLEHSDRAAKVQRYTYGPFGLLQTHTAPDGAVTHYSWDTEERPLSIANPIGQSWSYSYDKVGRVSSETDYNNSTTEYRHTSTGLVDTITPATGIPRHHTYNELGQLIGIRAESGEHVTYAYSPAGHLTTATSGGQVNTHTLRYTHTSGGRLLSQQLDGRPPTSYRYDRHGRCVGRTNPSGKTTDWVHDSGDRVKALATADHTIEFTHDPLGRQTGWRVGAFEHTQKYNSVGQVIARTLSLAGAPIEGSRHDEYTWRPDGYITQHNTFHGQSRALSRAYDLDPVGRVTALTSNGTRTQRFGYDQLSNITSVEDADLTSPSSIPVNSEGVQHEYDRNLLTRRGRTRYYYDAAGRLVQKKTSRISRKPSLWHFRYNAFDQLTDVFTADQQWWRYSYDAHGRRTTKTLLADEETVIKLHEYSWDRSRLIEESTPTSINSWDYQPDTYTPISETVIHIDQVGQGRHFHAIVTDIVGAPTEMVDVERSEISASAEVDLWGRAQWSGMGGTSIRFPGQQVDDETGLHYNYQRYYDPTSGRYLTQDPLGLQPAPNPNTYPHNPTSWIDPLGLSCSTAGGGSQSEPRPPSYGNGGHIDNISPNDARRIQNAANSRGVEINVVGSRATGTAGGYSDWDYVISDINSRTRSRIQGSLPQGSHELGVGRRVDIFTGGLVEGAPYVTFYPN
ncbi:RHS repeat-associated core domain-containing protein [Nocardia sp. NPDC058518]|uniref:RHS repeat-associated core domain-containing protein n=1 Tax=Nocardia sp. NPDC058518 TaxID=3346534 RepID=UPI003657CB56